MSFLRRVIPALAPKMDRPNQCFYQDHYALVGEMKTVGRGCRIRPEGPKIEAEGRERAGVLGEGQQALPAS